MVNEGLWIFRDQLVSMVQALDLAHLRGIVTYTVFVSNLEVQYSKFD